MPQKPVTFILFGATGDLALKKLFPALNTLFVKGILHPDSRIIAVSRRTWDDETFRAYLKETHPTFDSSFLAHIEYAEVELGIGIGYDALAKRLVGDTHERMVYLSLPPKFVSAVIEELERFKIITKGNGKLLIEKPFGTDLASAEALNRSLETFLEEEQVYRIDHYLGKGSVQAIMELHEESDGLQKLLSNKTVSAITVELLETKGIDARGSSYDGVGALRDVGQNHMLEMLAVLMAEYPQNRNTDAWQNARAAVLEALATPSTIDGLMRAQYEGYLNAEGVAEDSETETAFSIKTCFESGELRGIPITLRGGKIMEAQRAAVTVAFQEIEGFPIHMECVIQPDPRIIFRYRDGYEDVTKIPEDLDAYASIIRDALQGERRHFVGMSEVRASWRFTDALLATIHTTPLTIYSKEKPFT